MLWFGLNFDQLTTLTNSFLLVKVCTSHKFPADFSVVNSCILELVYACLITEEVSPESKMASVYFVQ